MKLSAIAHDRTIARSHAFLIGISDFLYGFSEISHKWFLPLVLLYFDRGQLMIFGKKLIPANRISEIRSIWEIILRVLAARILIALYFSYCYQFYYRMKTDMMLFCDGTLNWDARIVLKTTCEIDVHLFPNDKQRCFFRLLFQSLPLGLLNRS